MVLSVEHLSPAPATQLQAVRRDAAIHAMSLRPGGSRLQLSRSCTPAPIQSRLRFETLSPASHQCTQPPPTPLLSPLYPLARPGNMTDGLANHNPNHPASARQSPPAPAFTPQPNSSRCAVTQRDMSLAPVLRPWGGSGRHQAHPDDAGRRRSQARHFRPSPSSLLATIGSVGSIASHGPPRCRPTAAGEPIRAVALWVAEAVSRTDATIQHELRAWNDASTITTRKRRGRWSSVGKWECAWEGWGGVRVGGATRR